MSSQSRPISRLHSQEYVRLGASLRNGCVCQVKPDQAAWDDFSGLVYVGDLLKLKLGLQSLLLRIQGCKITPLYPVLGVIGAGDLAIESLRAVLERDQTHGHPSTRNLIWVRTGGRRD